jgi:hypothetical protein
MDHNQLFKRFVARTTFSLALVLLVCVTAIGQPQLAPKPNHGTISVTKPASNSQYFSNFGFIDNIDNLDNQGTIYNN